MITTLDKFITAQELCDDGKLTPGDLVEIDRIIYSHWVLYVGDGKVVHVAGLDSDIPSSDAYVIKCSILDVARDSLVRINNKLVRARERGLASLPCDVTVDRAVSMVGDRVKHNLMTMNSEHFVTQWKYGISWSDQAEAAYHGVFSSSPKTDPQEAHNTMLSSLKSLLHSPQQSDDTQTEQDLPLPTSLEHLRRNLLSQCSKVVLFPSSGQGETTHPSRDSLTFH